MEQKVRNWVNYDPGYDSTSELHNLLPSMTVPDLSLTVAELLERSQMGLPPEGERLPIYDEGDPYPDISRMDLVDRQNFIKYYQREIENLLTPKQATEQALQSLNREKSEQEVVENAIDQKLKDA